MTENAQVSRAHDVYAYGVISSSTLYRLRGAFPPAGGYAEIVDVQYMTGGEATNSSIVLSKLGLRVKLDGNWMGGDDAGQRTRALLASCQIDISRLPPREGYTGAREVVFSSQRARTIFGTYDRLLAKGEWNRPKDEDILIASVICLDPFFGDASYRVAEIGSAADIPVVTVDCGFDDPLLSLTSAVVIAQEFIQQQYPGHRPEDLFREYLSRAGGMVVFTTGANEIWYGRRGGPVRTFAPYVVQPVDTSGAGDSFRAGIAYGFLHGWSDEKLIGFASAVAALVCTRSPGVLNSPTCAEVHSFMSSYRCEP